MSEMRASEIKTLMRDIPWLLIFINSPFRETTEDQRGMQILFEESHFNTKSLVVRFAGFLAKSIGVIECLNPGREGLFLNIKRPIILIFAEPFD